MTQIALVCVALSKSARPAHLHADRQVFRRRFAVNPVTGQGHIAAQDRRSTTPRTSRAEWNDWKNKKSALCPATTQKWWQAVGIRQTWMKLLWTNQLKVCRVRQAGSRWVTRGRDDASTLLWWFQKVWCSQICCLPPTCRCACQRLYHVPQEGWVCSWKCVGTGFLVYPITMTFLPCPPIVDAFSCPPLCWMSFSPLNGLATPTLQK